METIQIYCFKPYLIDFLFTSQSFWLSWKKKGRNLFGSMSQWNHLCHPWMYPAKIRISTAHSPIFEARDCWMVATPYAPKDNSGFHRLSSGSFGMTLCGRGWGHASSLEGWGAYILFSLYTLINVYIYICKYSNYLSTGARIIFKLQKCSPTWESSLVGKMKNACKNNTVHSAGQRHLKAAIEKTGQEGCESEKRT